MKRTVISLAGTFALIAGAGFLWSQASLSPLPAGSVGAQIVGRIIMDANLTGELIGVFPVIAGIPNVFTAERNEASAFFTCRSTKFRVELTRNGSVFHLRTVPVEGDRILLNLYYDRTPNQDYSKPETFSDGQAIGSWRWHSSNGTLSQPLASLTGGVDYISSSDFTHQGQTLNLRTLAENGTILVDIAAPPVLGEVASVPFGTTFLVAR